MCIENKQLSSLLLNNFGYTGDIIAGDEVTAGIYIPPPDTDEHINFFLKCMQHPKHVPDATIIDSFTTEDYII